MANSFPSTEQEDVGSLDDLEPIQDQIIEEKDARTLRLDTVLAYSDAPEYVGKLFTWGENPVPVIDSTGREIGYASLYTEYHDGNLWADIYADYSSPDRLTLETEAFPLYAYPIGYIGTDVVRIFGVKLDTGKPSDPRIQPL